MENGGQLATAAEPRPGPARRSSLWESFKKAKPAKTNSAATDGVYEPGAEQMDGEEPERRSSKHPEPENGGGMDA